MLRNSYIIVFICFIIKKCYNNVTKSLRHLDIILIEFPYRNVILKEEIMSKLIAVSPVGKNGQTVVPVKIRKMFKVGPGNNLVGFYIDGSRVEIVPMSVTPAQIDSTETEMDKIGTFAGKRPIPI